MSATGIGGLRTLDPSLNLQKVKMKMSGGVWGQPIVDQRPMWIDPGGVVS